MLGICTTYDHPLKNFWAFQTISIERSTFLINSQPSHPPFPQNFFHFYGPVDLSFISRFVTCIGSLLESSIKSFEIRNIGKWSEISGVLIPECISLFRKWIVLIWSIIVALLRDTLIGLYMTGINFFWNKMFR